MTTRRVRASVLALSLLVAFLPAATGGTTSGMPEGAPDQLTAEQDNADPAHRTCGGERVAESGSEIHRKLVDGPRRAGTDELAFTSGICIYLPPGYRTSGLHYPVVYLLHGAWGWGDDWVVQGDLQAIMDRVRADDVTRDMIVVTPDGGYNGNWRDGACADVACENVPGSPVLSNTETYVLDHVIPYVDTYFRTIPDRRGRALSGLSNGGAGTLRMGAHRPDLFGVATAMSGALPVNTMVNRTDPVNVWNDPLEVAENLNEVELAITWGAECGESLTDDCVERAFGFGFENACCSAEAYNAKLGVVRSREWLYEPVTGGHEWVYWMRWFEGSHGEYYRRFLADPVADLDALGDLLPPERFDFRSIKDVVEIYEYTFDNDDARGTEFLTLTEVSSGSMTLTGSGTVTVTTAAVYVPGSSHAVTGAGDVVADADGRLTFTVDLGPANTSDEDVAGPLGLTKTTATITIG